MIEKYVSDLENANRTFLGLLPPETLAQMPGIRPTKVNARMKRHVVEKQIVAAFDFLESIHQEIHDSKPQWEKELIEKDLKALEKGITLDQLEVEIERPELTPEYLKSIGREDLLDWGSE